MEYKEHNVIWTDEKISRFWDLIAKNSKASESYFSKIAGYHALSNLSKYVNLKDKAFLDYGCGPGYLFEHLLKMKVRVKYYGLDFSKNSVEQLIEKYSHNNLFKGANVIGQALQTLEKKIEVAVVLEVIEHLSNEHLAELVLDIKKLLANGGIIYLTTPNNEKIDENINVCPDCGCHFHKWQHMRTWTKDTLKVYMEKNGFETIVVGTTVFENRFKNFIKTIYRNITNIKVEESNLFYVGRLK